MLSLADLTAVRCLMSEANKTALQKLYEEFFGKGDLRVADRLIGANYRDHLPTLPSPDRDGLKLLVQGVRAAFPDAHPVIDQMVSEDDRVAVRITTSATHRGEFVGIPPTNKKVEWTETHIYRFAGGKVVEHWGDIDTVGLLTQLGAMPGRPASATAS
jgi:predicted ester cyclase